MSRIILPATMENLERLLDFVEACAREAGLDSKNWQRLAIAAEEAIVNVIHYAYPEEVGDIEIECARRDDAVVLVIRDWGVPFDPLKAPEPDTSRPLEERPVGGMGILLIKKMIPALRYERKGNTNQLTLSIPLASERT